LRKPRSSRDPTTSPTTIQAKLAWIATTDPRLHRAYLLKEGLRHVFTVKDEEGKQALDRWISWARRCRIPAFVELARKIVKHHTAIDAAPSTTDCPRA
jgi:transposase